MAILAEKYAVDYSWYVDTILNLIRIAGDYVSEEVWYRVLQIVTNRDDVQGYAAKTVFEVGTPTSPAPRDAEAEAGQPGPRDRPARAAILLRPAQSSAWASPGHRRAPGASVGVGGVSCAGHPACVWSLTSGSWPVPTPSPGERRDACRPRYHRGGGAVM